jgi:hypothetical protein
VAVSGVEQAKVDCRDALGLPYTPESSEILTRPLKRQSLEVLLADHDRLSREVESVLVALAVWEKAESLPDCPACAVLAATKGEP